MIQLLKDDEYRLLFRRCYYFRKLCNHAIKEGLYLNICGKGST